MAFEKFPIRYGISTDGKVYYAVLMVEHAKTRYLVINKEDILNFIETVNPINPLFIIEEIPRHLGIDVPFIPREAELMKIVIDKIKSLKLNLYTPRYATLPTYYAKNYEEKQINYFFHKPLWLCTFNVNFDILNK